MDLPHMESVPLRAAGARRGLSSVVFANGRFHCGDPGSIQARNFLCQVGAKTATEGVPVVLSDIADRRRDKTNSASHSGPQVFWDPIARASFLGLVLA
eukprot:6897417-Pyramimonas_sp.AAC.1